MGGPFVLMFLTMFGDIAQWLSLLVVVLLASSSALYVVHASAPNERPYHSTTCNSLGTPFVDFFGSFFKLFEGSLSGDPYFECMHLLEYNSSDFWFSESIVTTYQ